MCSDGSLCTQRKRRASAKGTSKRRVQDRRHGIPTAGETRRLTYQWGVRRWAAASAAVRAAPRWPRRARAEGGPPLPSTHIHTLRRPSPPPTATSGTHPVGTLRAASRRCARRPCSSACVCASGCRPSSCSGAGSPATGVTRHASCQVR